MVFQVTVLGTTLEFAMTGLNNAGILTDPDEQTDIVGLRHGDPFSQHNFHMYKILCFGCYFSKNLFIF